MIPQSLNDQLTRIGPQTSAGKVLRQYWQPAALVDELQGEKPLPVNLMGERLVLCRNGEGELHLVTRQSSADERPTFHPDQVIIDESGPTYPIVEKRGIFFAFMGEGTLPEFPNFDCFRAPDTHVFAFKGL